MPRRFGSLPKAIQWLTAFAVVAVGIAVQCGLILLPPGLANLKWIADAASMAGYLCAAYWILYERENRRRESAEMECF